MGTASIDPDLRRRVRRRAAGRCEYCGYPEAACYAAFHCDHYLPRSKGGSTTFGNLVWACPNCNASKGDRIHAVDRASGKVVALFNPRLGRWNDHFTWSGDGLRIHGRTPNGRATISLLQMNRRGVRVIRMLLLRAGLHPAQP